MYLMWSSSHSALLWPQSDLTSKSPDEWWSRWKPVEWFNLVNCRMSYTGFVEDAKDTGRPSIRAVCRVDTSWRRRRWRGRQQLGDWLSTARRPASPGRRRARLLGTGDLEEQCRKIHTRRTEKSHRGASGPTFSLFNANLHWTRHDF